MHLQNCERVVIYDMVNFMVANMVAFIAREMQGNRLSHKKLIVTSSPWKKTSSVESFKNVIRSVNRIFNLFIRSRNLNFFSISKNKRGKITREEK